MKATIKTTRLYVDGDADDDNGETGRGEVGKIENEVEERRRVGRRWRREENTRS